MARVVNDPMQSEAYTKVSTESICVILRKSNDYFSNKVLGVIWPVASIRLR